MENLLAVPTWQSGCVEEMVILKENGYVLKYSFSNSLDNIQTAIYARTGRKINLGNALWRENPNLSISVKHLMNSHNVNYSMATDIIEKDKFVSINMRVGDNWYSTFFDEINGKFINWEDQRIFKRALISIMNYFEKNNSSSDDTDDD